MSLPPLTTSHGRHQSQQYHKGFFGALRKIERTALTEAEASHAMMVWKMHCNGMNALNDIQDLFHIVEALQIPMQPVIAALLEEAFRENPRHFSPSNLFRVLEQSKTLHKRWLHKVRGQHLDDDLLEAFVAIGGSNDSSGEVDVTTMKTMTADFNLDLDFSHVNQSNQNQNFSPPPAAERKNSDPDITSQPASPTKPAVREGLPARFGFHAFVDLLREDSGDDAAAAEDALIEDQQRMLAFDDNASFGSQPVTPRRQQQPHHTHHYPKSRGDDASGDEPYVLLSDDTFLKEDDVDLERQYRAALQANHASALEGSLNGTMSRRASRSGLLLPPLSHTPQPSGGGVNAVTRKGGQSKTLDDSRRSRSVLGGGGGRRGVSPSNGRSPTRNRFATKHQRESGSQQQQQQQQNNASQKNGSLPPISSPNKKKKFKFAT